MISRAGRPGNDAGPEPLTLPIEKQPALKPCTASDNRAASSNAEVQPCSTAGGLVAPFPVTPQHPARTSPCQIAPQSDGRIRIVTGPHSIGTRQSLDDFHADAGEAGLSAMNVGDEQGRCLGKAIPMLLQ